MRGCLFLATEALLALIDRKRYGHLYYRAALADIFIIERKGLTMRIKSWLMAAALGGCSAVYAESVQDHLGEPLAMPANMESVKVPLARGAVAGRVAGSASSTLFGSPANGP